MVHPDYAEEIHVGCVCAEKMTDDYINPRKSERALKNRNSRKNNFNRAQWNFNATKKTYSIKVNTLPLCKVDMETGVFFLLASVFGIMMNRKLELLKKLKE